MAGALGAIGTGSAASVVLTSCGGGEKAAALKPLKEPGTYYIPELPDLATDGQELKAGVIGCGGRGSGAAFNFLNAANAALPVPIAPSAPAIAELFKNDLLLILFSFFMI